MVLVYFAERPELTASLSCLFVCFIDRMFVTLDLTGECLLLLCKLMLVLVSSVLRQEIGWEERLRNDLLCFEWDVNCYLSSHYSVYPAHASFADVAIESSQQDGFSGRLSLYCVLCK